MNEQNNNTVNEKKPKLKYFLLAAIGVLLIVFGVIFLTKNIDNSGNKSFDNEVISQDVFFLDNKEGYYALFNIDGKKLTDFNLKPSNYEFINDGAVVKNAEGQYGIISSSGKMAVDFGKYKTIYREGALYSTHDEEYNDIILNSKGKVIRQGKDIGFIGTLFSSDIYTIAYNEEKYTIYNYDGKEIINIPKVEEAKIKSSRSGNYLSVNYNKVQYIIDLEKNKVISSFPAKYVYCIGESNKKKPGELILYNCDNDYNNSSYILYRDGKVVYEINDGNILFNNDNVILNKDGVQSLLDEQGNVLFNYSDGAYKDYKNYAKVNENNKVVIYVDGKEKTTVDCKYIKGYSNGVYAFYGCSSSKSAYYSDKGEKLFESEYSTRSTFDQNGYAILSDANTSMLVNKKGETISDKYQFINKDNNGNTSLYLALKDNDNYVLLDENGKEILSAERIYFNYSGEIDIAYAEIKYSDDSYELYNTRTKKSIMKSKSDITAYNKYVKTSENGKTQYYSYTTGKMFFEE